MCCREIIEKLTNLKIGILLRMIPLISDTGARWFWNFRKNLRTSREKQNITNLKMNRLSVRERSFKKITC